MANFTRQRASGLWVPGSVVLQEEFEGIDDIRPKLINATDGSTHAPSTQIVLGGSGLRVSGPSRLDSITLGALAATGTFTVSDNSILNVAGGAAGGLIRVDTGAVPGRIDLDGANAELRVKSGTFISVKAGGALDVFGAQTLKSTAALTAESGSLIILNAGMTATSSGDFFFSTSTWPQLSPTRTWYRRSLLIATTTYDGGTDSPPALANGFKVPIVGGGDQIQTRSTQRSSDYTLIEFADIPQNGTIVQIEIVCIGNGAGTAGMSFPSFQAVRWRGTSMDTMSALVADTHVLGNWPTTPISSTIMITSNAVINRDYQYGLMIYHAYYAGSPAGTGLFYGSVMTGTAVDMRI